MCQNGARYLAPRLLASCPRQRVSRTIKILVGRVRKTRETRRRPDKNRPARLRGEGIVLTLRCRARSSAHSTAALVLSSFTVLAICGAAHAEGSGVGGCIGSWDTLNCVVRWGPIGDPYVRQVPEPASDTERGVATDRERRWEQHCRPQIAPDRYGVPRYLYAAPGCEFGAY
jgi:hypothetical protein